MSRRRDRSAEAAMRAIENRVLEEIWIGRTRGSGGKALAAVLAAIAVFGGIRAERAGHDVALVAHGLFGLAAITSLAGLRIRQFKWCCAATYGCAVATAVGIGAFWWYRTGTASVSPWPTAFASAAAGLLTAGWLGVILTPIERSQPDMRSYTSPSR